MNLKAQLTCMMLIVGCGGSSAPSEIADASADASAYADATSDSATDAAVCGEPTIPPTLPPTASVRFRFSGTGRVATFALNCAAFTIKHAEGTGRLRLVPPFSCACECAAPQRNVTLSSAASDGTFEMEWIASELVPYSECIDCADYGWPSVGLSHATRTVGTAVAAGNYTATFLVFDEEDRPTSSDFEAWHYGSNENDLCPYRGSAPPREVTVDFTLPESGEVVVDVAIEEPGAD